MCTLFIPMGGLQGDVTHLDTCTNPFACRPSIIWACPPTGVICIRPSRESNRPLWLFAANTRFESGVSGISLLFKKDQSLARFYGITWCHFDGFNCPGRLSLNLNFHLHRVENQEEFVVLYLLAWTRM